MARPTRALDRTIVVVDVVGFTAPDRNRLDRLAVHQGMYEVLILLPPGTTESLVADLRPDRGRGRYRFPHSRRATSERSGLVARVAPSAACFSEDFTGMDYLRPHGEAIADSVVVRV
ncbi:hypothetical protein AB0C24_17380 [Amycolatopsis japonica]|uniref:hypothetical protein n=1 Tax=Amycolatopsis japonica TaxID=208439 RepID=UPI0033EF10BD